MTRPLRRVAMTLMLLLLALLINDNYVQVVDASSLQADPNNIRQVYEEYSHQRGEIVIGGKNVAYSVSTTDEFQWKRVYSDPELYADVTGYKPLPMVGHPTEIEYYENGILAGTDPRLSGQKLADEFSGSSYRGGSVVLTINPAAQEAAYQGLTSLGSGVKGAVVALDPSTGAILAMVSTPSYDPNPLSSQSVTTAGQAQRALACEYPAPGTSTAQTTCPPTDGKAVPGLDLAQLNQGLYGTFPPGSTFKLVTAATALQNGYSPDTAVPVGSAYKPPESGSYSLPNEGGFTCGSETLDEGLQRSCNTVYGYLGVNLAWTPDQQQNASLTQQIAEAKQSQQLLAEQAKKFGFGQSVNVPMPAALSCIQKIDGGCSDATMDPASLAKTAIGQQSNQTTPLQICMVAAGIANHGKVMKPYLVQEERAADLSVVSEASPQPLDVDGDNGQAMSQQSASELTQMMENVVNNGTATNVQMSGVQVAAKTGTAQTGVDNDNNPYAWMVAFAPADNPKVAVAVVVSDPTASRDEISGNGIAGPIAKKVMQAVIGQ